MDRWQAKFAAAACSEAHADALAANPHMRFKMPLPDAQDIKPAGTAVVRTSAPDSDGKCDRECSREEPGRGDFFASSMVAAKAVMVAEALHNEIPGKVEQVAASHADARRLWEGWKLQPTCLPVLEPFERHRVLHDCGITLVAYKSGTDDYVTTV